MSEIDALFKHNCSTLFLLYPLGLERRKLIEFGFRSAYISDTGKDTDYENPVFLLFKPEDITMFQAFVDSEYVRVNPHTETFDLREDYDQDKGYVVLLYQFPDEFKEDYEKFLEGKYSKFSAKFKETYPKMIKIKQASGLIRDVISTQYKIIHNTKKIREEVAERNELDIKEELEKRLGVTFSNDMEVWQMPGEKDILKIEEIIKEDNPKKSKEKT